MNGGTAGDVEANQVSAEQRGDDGDRACTLAGDGEEAAASDDDNKQR